MSAFVPGRGWSVFAIDPGETTGYAWAAIGAKEVRKHGISESIKRALDESLELSRFGHTPIPGDSFPRFGWGEVDCRSMDGIEEVVRLIFSAHELIRMGTPLGGLGWIVPEAFVLNRSVKDASLLSPVRVSAMIQYAVRKQINERGTAWEEQESAAKAVVPNDKLKAWGLYARGSEHQRDAMRHLIVKLRRLYALNEN